MNLRMILPLALMASCFGQSTSTSTYRMIVTSQYSGYSFTSYHQSIIQSRVSDLGMSPKVTVVCPQSVCPALVCPSRSYSYFQQNGCSLVSASERNGEVLQNTGTYVEYVFYDTNPATSTPFATRVATASSRLSSAAQVNDQTVTYADVTTTLSGAPIVATPLPFSTTPSPSDDDIAKQWWFWLLIGLIILCCCCIAAYFLCFKKKKNKEEQHWKDHPQEMGTMFVPGDAVDALYDGKWFGATVVGGNARDGYSLEWDDGSVSDHVNPSDMRLKRAPPVTEVVPQTVVTDAPIGVGQPVVALSGGKYHSGVVRSVRGDSVMVEKADGALQQFHAGSLQRDLYNEEVISARSGSPSPPGHTMYRVG
eukprot:TRINITY_DN114_c8_g1_i1.p1 TRINITY_DN114_c8_g1~~TRINITY_DN114_c8_g1_i1.p1  ORF type:complete len:365 (+),score=40.37 TRINITY_DN114_c8_g1_i1:61-1155(+)